jgi:hypothetical protein
LISEKVFKTFRALKKTRMVRANLLFSQRVLKKRKFVSKRQRRRGLSNFKRMKLLVSTTNGTRTNGNRKSSGKVSFKSVRSLLALKP